MVDPLFWLGLSCLLVAVSLTAVLIAALPALRELGRAAQSAEKLFDTLNRELPPTLEALRLTGQEIADLTDDVGESVYQAGKVIQQVEQGVSTARQQAQQVQVGTQSLMAGFKAAWRTWSRPSSSSSHRGKAQAGRKYSPQGKNLRSRPSALPANSPTSSQKSRPSADTSNGATSHLQKSATEPVTEPSKTPRPETSAESQPKLSDR